jgi:putative transposase
MSKSRSPQEWEEWRREVALFRYALARECVDSALTARERGRLIGELVGREHTGPDGRPTRVGRSTLDRWIRAYRTGGYAALVPQPPKVLPRTPARVIELAIALKRENLDRTAAQIHAILTAAGEPGVPTARALQTHLSRAGLNHRADGRTPSKVYGRFEATAPNQLWTGDGLHGPKLASTGRRAVLLAFIDDHSRLVVGWRWVPGEDVFGLEAALRPALMARGVPEAVLVDRGSAFVSSQLLRACAVLGAKLIHARPRAATTKGKIERFFRTCRDRFLVELSDRDDLELAELNRLFGAWLEVVYHQRVHSETGQTPLARFATAAPVSSPSPDLLRDAFLWSQNRMVTKTATVSLFGNDYEVDPALVGRRCELLFDPFDLTAIEVRHNGRPLGLAKPLRVDRHVHPKAAPQIAPAPTPTGIDYLELLAAQRDGDLAGERIDYASLTDRAHDDQAEPDPDTDEEERR